MRIPSYTESKNHAKTLVNQFASVEDLRLHFEKNRKIINSSEDPVLAQRIKTVSDYLSYLDSYHNNILMGQTRTAFVESNITGSLNSVNRIAELVKNAQNDTLNNTDRKNVSTELKGILNTMLGFANARDSQGDYIFSGNSAKTQPFVEVNGSFKYMGSLENNLFQPGQAISMIYGECGQDVFGDIMTGNGVFEINPGATQNAGTAQTSIGSVTDRSNYVEDTYTITFVTNASNQLAYQVVGANSGQVIPAPPATTPADAPAYNPAGQVVNFNGISFDIKGSPALSDQFVVSPSKKQNAFETVNQLANLLASPVTTDAERATLHQKLTQLQGSMSQVALHLANRLSEVGYRAKELDSVANLNSEEITNQKKVLGDFQNADYVDLISQMTEQSRTLELTNEIYKKLQEVFTNLLK